MKKEILKMILDKIKECQEREKPLLIIDRIDVVALKELYNEALKTLN
jgi:hypothetical protein